MLLYGTSQLLTQGSPCLFMGNTTPESYSQHDSLACMSMPVAKEIGLSWSVPIEISPSGKSQTFEMPIDA